MKANQRKMYSDVLWYGIKECCVCEKGKKNTENQMNNACNVHIVFFQLNRLSIGTMYGIRGPAKYVYLCLLSMHRNNYNC